MSTDVIRKFKIVDGAKPDLIIYANRDIGKTTVLDNVPPFFNNINVKPVFGDAKGENEIGYYQWDYIYNEDTKVASGMSTFYLPQGTITGNFIVKVKDGLEEKGLYVNEILSGTGDFLGSKGIGVTVLDLEVNNIITFLVYFEK